MKLPLELVLLSYELLPVDSEEEVNVKYQTLVDMKCQNFYSGSFHFLAREIPIFKHPICFFNKNIGLDNYMIILGQLEVLKYLVAEGYLSSDRWDQDQIELATENGHPNILNWFKGLGVYVGVIDMYMIFIMVSSGNVEIVKWFHENNSRRWSRDSMNYAAGNGHLGLVKWLHANRTEGCNTNAMNWAAANGHLDVVKWLHENRTEGCTKVAMDSAAASGHLEAVKWLHENRSEGCTTSAMNYAARFGHLHVIKWLHENRIEGCTENAMDDAAANGQLDVVKWLNYNRTEGCTRNAMNGAAYFGHLDVIKWLHENRSEGCSIRALEGAFYQTHFEIASWLLNNRTELQRVDIVGWAAEKESLKTLKWLYEHHRNRLKENHIEQALNMNPSAEVTEYLKILLEDIRASGTLINSASTYSYYVHWFQMTLNLV